MKELTNFSFGRQVEENRKINNGEAQAKITEKIYQWFTKRFARGSCSCSSLESALRDQKISVHRTKRFDCIETSLTCFGDVYRVWSDNGGGMFNESTSKFFKE